MSPDNQRLTRDLFTPRSADSWLRLRLRAFSASDSRAGKSSASSAGITAPRLPCPRRCQFWLFLQPAQPKATEGGLGGTARIAKRLPKSPPAAKSVRPQPWQLEGQIMSKITRSVMTSLLMSTAVAAPALAAPHRHTAPLAARFADID